MLINFNCHLPIEIHYSGNELSQVNIDRFKRLGTLPRDISDKANVRPGEPERDESYDGRSYHLKILAIINSRFEEVLYIDSDNYPIRNPEYLFELEEYKMNHAIFWPDFWKTSPDNPIWNMTEVPCRDEYEQESGQILINKSKVWKGLMLANYFGEHFRWWNRFLLGDKDMFRFAFLALRQPFYMIDTPITIAGFPTADSQYICGHTMIQNDIRGNPIFAHANMIKALPKSLLEGIAQQEGYSNDMIWMKYVKFKKTSNPDHMFASHIVSGYGYVHVLHYVPT